MLILGIDPASTTQHGYAIWCTDRQRIVYAQPYAPETHCQVAAVEGRWTRGSKMGKAHISSLAFDAGLRLGRSGAPVMYEIVPNTWRSAVRKHFGWRLKVAELSKTTIVARLRRDMGLPEDWSDDVVEAAGIALSVTLLSKKQLKACER